MTGRTGALALALAVLAAGCARRENVVLVVVDTLRADRLGCYGHDRPTSPFIDSLARQGVVFEQAYAPAPWTVPSTASLMTSLYAREHGCRHGFIERGARGVADQEVLDESFETLAERMKARGYRTYGVSANPHIAREMGFAQGFDAFETLWLADAPEVNKVIAAWAREMRGPRRKPWFLYVHYFDPHAPYVGREPWLTAFSEGRTLHRDYDGLDHLELNAMFGRGMRQRAGNTQARADFVREVRQALLDLYDSEVACFDGRLRELFTLLGIDARRTTVIVTSDHGEEFLEHDHITGHGRSLYESAVRIPLIWCGPHAGAAPGTRIRTPVSHTDILPTLLAVNGAPAMPGACGVSLAAALATGREPPERSLIMETERYPDAVYLGVRDGAWKFMMKRTAGGEVYHMLVDLARDPGENENLAAREGEAAGRFAAGLEAWARERPPREARRQKTQLDEKRLQELRSLGYLK